MGNGGGNGGGGGTGDLGDAFGYAGPGWGDQGGGIGQGGGVPGAADADAALSGGLASGGPGYGQGGPSGQGAGFPGGVPSAQDADVALSGGLTSGGPGYGQGGSGKGQGTQEQSTIESVLGVLPGQKGVPTSAFPSNSISGQAIGKGMAYAAMVANPIAGAILGTLAGMDAFSGPQGDIGAMGEGLGDVAGTTGREGGGINSGRTIPPATTTPPTTKPPESENKSDDDEPKGRRYTLLTEGGLQYRPRVRRRTLIGR